MLLNQMVEHTSLDTVFQALAHPSRRAMLNALRGGERTVGELAAPHSMSFAGASKHVKVLERAGLLVRDVRGRTHVCRLDAAGLEQVRDWVETYRVFWNERLDALQTVLQDEENP